MLHITHIVTEMRAKLKYLIFDKTYDVTKTYLTTTELVKMPKHFRKQFTISRDFIPC